MAKKAPRKRQVKRSRSAAARTNLRVGKRRFSSIKAKMKYLRSLRKK